LGLHVVGGSGDSRSSSLRRISSVPLARGGAGERLNRRAGTRHLFRRCGGCFVVQLGMAIASALEANPALSICGMVDADD
jgi:hypothetical protein